MVEEWWRRPFRVFQTNIREIDAGLDVEREPLLNLLRPEDRFSRF